MQLDTDTWWLFISLIFTGVLTAVYRLTRRVRQILRSASRQNPWRPANGASAKVVSEAGKPDEKVYHQD